MKRTLYLSSILNLILLSCVVKSQKWDELTWTTSEPEDRSFHSVSSFRVDNRIVLATIFGGIDEFSYTQYNDVWGFTIDFDNPENNQWALLHNGSGSGAPVPVPRYGHQTIVLDTDDDISTLSFLLFGGYGGSSYYYSSPLQDTWFFTVDATTSTWSQVAPTQVPSSRYLHAMVPLILNSLDPSNDQKYSGVGLIGGANDSYAMNDFWVFTTESNNWFPVDQTGDVIGARYGHSAVVYNGDIYVFGGKDTSQYFADVWKLSLSDLSWEQLNDGTKDAPRARYGHNAASVRGGFIVFGGELDNGTIANDLWFFDASSKTWEDLTEASVEESNSTLPSPRYGAAAQGIAELSVRGRDSTLVVFGGQDNTATFNDVWYLNIPKDNSDGTEVIGPSITGAFMIIGFVAIPVGMSVFYTKQ